MRFVDTNILLYAISTDPREAREAKVAASVHFRALAGAARENRRSAKSRINAISAQ